MRNKISKNASVDVQKEPELGSKYFNGDGAKQDYAKAVEHFTAAAFAGNAVAQFMLGNCYALGMGVKQKPAKAAWWFTHAAEQGHGKAREILQRLRP